MVNWVNGWHSFTWRCNWMLHDSTSILDHTDTELYWYALEHVQLDYEIYEIYEIYEDVPSHPESHPESHRLQVFLLLFLRGHDHPPRLPRRTALRQEVRRHLGKVHQGGWRKWQKVTITTWWLQNYIMIAWIAWIAWCICWQMGIWWTPNIQKQFTATFHMGNPFSTTLVPARLCLTDTRLHYKNHLQRLKKDSKATAFLSRENVQDIAFYSTENLSCKISDILPGFIPGIWWAVRSELSRIQHVCLYWTKDDGLLDVLVGNVREAIDIIDRPLQTLKIDRMRILGAGFMLVFFKCLTLSRKYVNLLKSSKEKQEFGWIRSSQSHLHQWVLGIWWISPSQSPSSTESPGLPSRDRSPRGRPAQWNAERNMKSVTNLWPIVANEICGAIEMIDRMDQKVGCDAPNGFSAFSVHSAIKISSSKQKISLLTFDAGRTCCCNTYQIPCIAISCSERERRAFPEIDRHNPAFNPPALDGSTSVLLVRMRWCCFFDK